MKLVVQRVRRAAVRVNGETISSMERGLLILCGVARGDTLEDAQYLARKTVPLRVFDDAAGKMNLSVREVGGTFLVVSQFAPSMAIAPGGTVPAISKPHRRREGRARL